MRRTWMLCALLACVLTPWAASGKTKGERADEVRAAEKAFAKTMADRDLAAFATFVSKEGLFFGPRGALRGRDSVVAAWKGFFDGEKAPFSWEPETVEVLDSGTLALTSGPVFDPDGKRVATFNSIWRLERGRWQVIFDKGAPVCDPK